MLFNYLLQLADNQLILSQRLSELCGHGPALEQDIALTNISLDLIGQARLLFQYAEKLDDKKRNEDQLALVRAENEYRNVLLVEQPNVDFAHVIVRQYFYDEFNYLNYSALVNSKDETLAAIATKSLMEVKYHRRFSRNWLLRLGDGTAISNQKMQNAVNNLWAYPGELFVMTAEERILVKADIAVDVSAFKQSWEDAVKATLTEATLTIPEGTWHQTGGKKGIHSEHLGHILSEMQFLQRTYPNLTW